MFDQIGNMPLHPLVLHCGRHTPSGPARLSVRLPRTRKWARWAFGVTVLGATAATFVTRQSGKALQRKLNLQPGTVPPLT